MAQGGFDEQAQRQALNELFVACCCTGDATNISQLSQPKFIKILSQCGLVDGRSFTRAEAEIAVSDLCTELPLVRCIVL